MMNILFAATPQIALETLKTIHESEHNLVGVLCGEEKRSGRGLKINKSPIKVFAEEEEIKIFSYDEIKNEQFKLSLEKLDLDLLLVFAFGYILKEDLLNLPKYGSLNIHTSLLPKYRGAAPIQRSLINCEKETGITIHHVNANYDEGVVIFQVKCRLDSKDTAETVAKKVHDLEMQHFPRVIKDFVLKND